MIYDVIVIGGGPSGTLAAWSAARSGAKVLLIEEGPYLGGMLTKGGVGPQMSYHAGDKQVVVGLPQLLIERMKKLSFSPGHIRDPIGFASSITPFDPEGLKIIWEKSLLDDGVELLFYSRFIDCEVKNDKIKTIKVLCREGIQYFQARVFVDCAGGELAVKTPCPHQYGRRRDNMTQPMTMNFRVGNVNRDEVINFIKAHPEDMYFSMETETIDQCKRVAFAGAFSLIAKAKEVNEFSIERDRVLLFETNNRGEFLVNISRIIGLKSNKSKDLTLAEIEGRRQIYEIYIFLKKYIPGFSSSHIVSSGPYVGIREGFHIQAAYQLTADDLISNHVFGDAIACGGYPIDIHSPDGKDIECRSLLPGSWYQIPYRSLYSNQVKNLIVAGRALGAEHEALAAIRVSPILEAVGQAAGTAAAVASMSQECDVRSVNVDTIQCLLKKEGAFIEPYLMQN